MSAFVISKDGKPLMPTRSGYAKMLIQKGKAFCKYVYPFTIQLTYETTTNIDDCTLGIDPGYLHIGFSVISKDKELIGGVLEQEKGKKPSKSKKKGKILLKSPTNATGNRLTERAMYRRNRRSRKWHRPARWENRANNKKEGWLPPSINRKMNTHVSMVNKLKKLVPITKVIIEKNKFDIQKLNNPEIEGVEYQQGKLYQSNRKAYLLDQQGGICSLCKKTLFNTKTHIHHIMPRSNGGNDTVDNLVLLHDECHQNIDHDHWKVYQKKFDKIGKVSDHQADTFMNIVMNRLINDLNADITYGYITSCKRSELGLEKEHYNDAFVIAGGENQVRSKPYIIKQLRRNDRSLQTNNRDCKGGRSVRKANYEYKKGDLIYVDDGKWYVCGGTSNYGRYVYNGKRKPNGNPDYVKVSSVLKRISQRGLIFTQMGEIKTNINI